MSSGRVGRSRPAELHWFSAVISRKPNVELGPRQVSCICVVLPAAVAGATAAAVAAAAFAFELQTAANAAIRCTHGQRREKKIKKKKKIKNGKRTNSFLALQTRTLCFVRQTRAWQQWRTLNTLNMHRIRRISCEREEQIFFVF